MPDRIYTRNTKISITVEHGSNDGVPEDFLRVNVWTAEPKGWTFFKYLSLEADHVYVARLALWTVATKRKQAGLLRPLRPTCSRCGQEVPE